MSEQHVELILQWKADADTNRVRDWLKERGIDFMPMQAGLLIFGKKETFDRNLSVSLDDITPPSQIPIPVQLQNDVTSIMLPTPRRPYA